MSDHFDSEVLSPDDVDDTPRVGCSRCDAEWDLGYELDELRVGNQALERFALDHRRHTGHFPDDVTPWVAACRQCPDGEEFLSRRPARRWAETHARHARHRVRVEHADEDEPLVVEPDAHGDDSEGDEATADAADGDAEADVERPSEEAEETADGEGPPADGGADDPTDVE